MFRIAVLLVCCGLSSAVWAFQPFSPVNDVCPTCPQPSADELTLSDGQSIRGTVIGENTSFYVMLRYQEVRAIPKNRVAKVAWASGSRPEHVLKQDQILLKRGHVLNGRIVEDKVKPAIFQIKLSHGQTVAVFKSEISKVYRDGLEVSF